MNRPHSVTVTILQTSDLHGHIYPTDYRSLGDKPIGLAKLAGIVRKERAIDPSLLLLDNGDWLQGSAMMSYYAKSAVNGVHPAAKAMTALRYDAAVIGNHEFNYGLELLNGVIDHSPCPWLSANIVRESDGQPAFGQPYRMFDMAEGIRVAVLGITTPFIPNWELPGNIEGLAFHDPVETAQRWLAYIREYERPDAIVVSYHGGFERSLTTGEATEPLTGENQGYEMCMRLEGMDVLLTGHQHRLIAQELNGVTITQTGYAGQALAKVMLTFEHSDDGRWTLQHKSAELLMVEDYTEAEDELLHMFAEDERLTQQWLDQPIGMAEGDLTIGDPFAARQADHAFTEFVNRVQMETMDASISCASIFTDEARGFDKEITMRDIVSNYMYPNTLKVIRLSGRDIREALELNARYFDTDEHTGALRICRAFLEPKPQHFNYDMWEGIEYVLDISQPEGQRVVKLQWNGGPMEDDAAFEVAMNSYRAGGGGNFDMIKNKPVVREVTTDMADIIADYVRKHGTIRAACDHNWKVVG